MKQPNKDDVKNFTYSGNDGMINFSVDKIPPVHKDFKGTLKLKNGTEISAKGVWLKRIWDWWYTSRKDEIETSCLTQVSDHILSANIRKH